MKYIAGIIASLFGVVGSIFMIYVGYVSRGMPHSAGIAEKQGNLLIGIFSITGIICFWLIFWLNRRRKEANKSVE